MTRLLIKTNLKNTSPTYETEHHRVLVMGKNGSGKSAIVHTIEYALTGFIMDAGGRDIKAPGYLDTMARDAHAAVQVDLLQADRVIERHDGKKAKHTGYDHVMYDALQVIGGSSTALVDYLLVHGTDYDELPVEVSLGYDGWDRWVTTEGSVRAALLRIKQTTSKALSATRAKIKELKCALKYVTDSYLYTERADELEERLRGEVAAEAKTKELKKDLDAAALAWVKEVCPRVEEGAQCAGFDLKFYFVRKEVRLGLRGCGPVPSGAEMVEAAMGLAYATRDEARAVYILPDRAYDPERLGHLLTLLARIPCIVAVVQSPIAPVGCEYMGTTWTTLVAGEAAS